MEWERDVGAAVQSLSHVNMRMMRKGCKVKPFSSSTPSSSSSPSSSSAAPAKQAQARGKLYIMLEDEKAIDLAWLGYELPDHLIGVLISEKTPPSVAAVLKRHQKSGRWITHLSHCVNVLFCLANLSSDFPLIFEHVFSSKAPPSSRTSQAEKIVDAMLFCFTVGVAVQCSEQDQAEFSQDDDDPAATVEEESRTAGGESEVQGEDSTTSSQTDGILPGDAVVSGSSAVDLIGHALQVLATLLRMECRAREGGRKGEDSDQLSFRRDLVTHSLITETICDGLFDAISIFISQVDETRWDGIRRSSVYFSSPGAAMTSPPSLDGDFVADLLVSNHMQDDRHCVTCAQVVASFLRVRGETVNILKENHAAKSTGSPNHRCACRIRHLQQTSDQVLIAHGQPHCPSRSLARGSSGPSGLVVLTPLEDGGALRRRLQLQAACDRRVFLCSFTLSEHFLASLTHPEQLPSPRSSREARTTMVSEGFRLHLPPPRCSSHTLIPLLARLLLLSIPCQASPRATRCICPSRGPSSSCLLHYTVSTRRCEVPSRLKALSRMAKVMKAEEENLFVRSLRAECRSREEVEGIKSSLESLQNLPELSKRSKETIVEEVSEATHISVGLLCVMVPVLQEDLELLRDLTEAFLQADHKKEKPHAARKTKAGGRGGRRGSGEGTSRVPDKSQEEFSKHTEQSRKKGRAKAQRARARLTEEEQIRLAIEASLKEQ
eukprot:768766-Hanusia_phi.AAC.13